MKSFNLFKSLLLAILSFIAFPIMAQSGSYTLSESDIETCKSIPVPPNVLIKITYNFDENLWVQIWTQLNDIYYNSGPESGEFTTKTGADGVLHIFASDNLMYGGPYEFTVNWVVYSTPTSENSYIPGNSVVDGHLSIGDLRSPGKLGIKANDQQYSLYSINNTNSPYGSYGLYSRVQNNSGSPYGVYSYVGGGGSSNRRWSGYFAGGDVAVMGGNVGIGVETPNASNKLEVHGKTAIGQYTNGTAVIDAYNSYAYFGCNTATNGIAIGPNGNVGVGITPTAKLDVNGKVFLRNAATIAGWAHSYLNWEAHSLVMGTPAGSYAYNSVDLEPGGCTNAPLWSQLRMFTAANQTNHQLKIQLNTGGDCFFNNDGRVGIGTSTPDALLTVNGTIHAIEVLVDLKPPFSDFVFDENYKLMPLHQVEQYVKANSHLPEIPSAAEVSKNGINIGELQNKLLQKIEELTLYVIEQQKRIEVLEKNQK